MGNLWKLLHGINRILGNDWKFSNRMYDWIFNSNNIKSNENRSCNGISSCFNNSNRLFWIFNIFKFSNSIFE